MQSKLREEQKRVSELNNEKERIIQKHHSHSIRRQKSPQGVKDLAGSTGDSSTRVIGFQEIATLAPPMGFIESDTTPAPPQPPQAAFNTASEQTVFSSFLVYFFLFLEVSSTNFGNFLFCLRY